ncbi:MAG: ABC transporter permease subunit [Thermoplasmatota archaeon]
MSVLLSVLAFLLATDKELSLLAQKDMLNLTVQVTVALGGLLTLLAAADGFSGERERGTLESILLTPTPRLSLALGKLAAALTLFVATFLVSLPYLLVLSNGTQLLQIAVLLAFGSGALLAIALGSVGIVVSMVSRTNRASLAASLLTFLVLVAPTQLPATTRKGLVGDVIARANPVTALATFVDKILVSNHSFAEEASQLVAPTLLALVGILVVVVLARCGIRLEGGFA